LLKSTLTLFEDFLIALQYLPSFPPLSCFSGIPGPEGAKNLAGEDVLRLIQTRFSDAEFGKNPTSLSRQNVTSFKFCSLSHDTVIRVYDEAGNVIETHEQKGEFKEP
jgi:hypothetical protein